MKGGSEIRFRLTFRVRHLFGERRFPQSVFRFDHLSTPASGETQGLPLGRTKTRAGKHSVTGRSTYPLFSPLFPPPPGALLSKGVVLSSFVSIVTTTLAS